MEIISNIEEFYIPASVVALGKFDGVHLGHQAIAAELKKGKKEGVSTVLITFSVSPESVLSGKNLKYLMTEKEKEQCIDKIGIDYLIDIKLKKNFLDMEAEAFVKDYLVDRLRVKKVVCGPNFRFGKNRSGNLELLKECGMNWGFQTTVVQPVCMENRTISSTRIRQQILEGNISFANSMMGHPYQISGEVVHGKQLGRTINFPTANIYPQEEKILPPNGVYLSRCIIEKKHYNSITNIGLNPTVGGVDRPIAETHVLGFYGDLYHQFLTVELYDFIRQERKFSSLDELRKQIADDISRAERIRF